VKSISKKIADRFDCVVLVESSYLNTAMRKSWIIAKSWKQSLVYWFF